MVIGCGPGCSHFSVFPYADPSFFYHSSWGPVWGPTGEGVGNYLLVSVVANVVSLFLNLARGRSSYTGTAIDATGSANTDSAVLLQKCGGTRSEELRELLNAVRWYRQKVLMAWCQHKGF